MTSYPRHLSEIWSTSSVGNFLAEDADQIMEPFLAQFVADRRDRREVNSSGGGKSA
jgi:hypothetical protein